MKRASALLLLAALTTRTRVSLLALAVLLAVLPARASADCSEPGGCQPVCGDGHCTLAETPSSCPDDCGVCGDGVCDASLGEAFGTCLPDCGGPPCGDGICDEANHESSATCEDDCYRICAPEFGCSLPSCGNGTCDEELGETHSNCLQDCGGPVPLTCPRGGNGVCDPFDGEVLGVCEECLCVNRNGVCDAGEDEDHCPWDCGPELCYPEAGCTIPSCGNHVCERELGELPANCPDCRQVVRLFPPNVPPTLGCGQRFAASVTVENAGLSTWQASDETALQLQAGDPLSATRRIPLPRDLGPGETFTFEYEIVAPAQAGDFAGTWQLTDRYGSFGPAVQQSVHVSGAACAVPDRLTVKLIDNSSIFVDNLSSLGETAIAQLVSAADVSTGAPCHGKKGLMRSGDRVVITDAYIAWFDFTKRDGLNYSKPGLRYLDGSGKEVPWGRSGSFAGYWPLLNGDFRYRTSGPNGCTFSRNFLIPGSASVDSEHTEYFWDRFAPPTEQCLANAPTPSQNDGFFCHHYSQDSGPAAGWQTTKDGTRDGEGVHYETRAFLANPRHQVDIVDQTDGDDIEGKVDSVVEYVCGRESITVKWRFSPSRNYTVDNMYMGQFQAYAQDEDTLEWTDDNGKKHPCDIAGDGDQYPGPVFEQSRYYQSNIPMVRNSPPQAVTPEAIIELPLQEGCPNGDLFVNPDVHTEPPLRRGARLAIGASPSLAPSERRWVFTALMSPGSCDSPADCGSYDNPEHLAFDNLVGFNERRDGTTGFTIGRGPQANSSFVGGRWYLGSYCVSQDFGCSERGNTPAGVNVSVTPVDLLRGQSPVQVTLEAVAKKGDTTLLLPAEGPLPPQGWLLSGSSYYSLQTTASTSGQISVCMSYRNTIMAPSDPDPTSGGKPTGRESSPLRLFQYKVKAFTDDTPWLDITTSHDLEQEVICGTTDYLSTFAILLPDSGIVVER